VLIKGKGSPPTLSQGQVEPNLLMMNSLRSWILADKFKLLGLTGSLQADVMGMSRMEGTVASCQTNVVMRHNSTVVVLVLGFEIGSMRVC